MSRDNLRKHYYDTSSLANSTQVMPKADQPNSCQHVQLGGTAYYGPATNNFFFTPDNPVPDRVTKFRKQGVGLQLSDGTFDFVPAPDRHSQAKLIRKLAHGRVSETKDGAIQLTVKVFADENICISEAILEEAVQAVEAIRQYQLKR